jgi:hypothetical protein
VGGFGSTDNLLLLSPSGAVLQRFDLGDTQRALASNTDSSGAAYYFLDGASGSSIRKRTQAGECGCPASAREGVSCSMNGSISRVCAEQGIHGDSRAPTLLPPC